MPWETRKIEERMYAALDGQLPASRAQVLKTLYEAARHKLVTHVYNQISSVTPGMTDHSAAHVADVLDNAYALVGNSAFIQEPPPLSGVDAYTLCLAILFHDTGMVYGREGHEFNLGRVYEWVRENADAPAQERSLVYKAASAHTGEGTDGSRDTVRDVPETSNLEGERVQLREIAALLRFADELAEGPQRTSRFMLEEFGYAEELYHQYASIATVHVDRDNGRVVLNYLVRLGKGNGKHDPEGDAFRDLIAFTFHRIIKLDRERRFARFYSRRLAPFNRTEVTLEFWSAGLPLDYSVAVTLSDRTVLDDDGWDLSSMDTRYGVDTVCKAVRAALEDQ